MFMEIGVGVDETSSLEFLSNSGLEAATTPSGYWAESDLLGAGCIVGSNNLLQHEDCGDNICSSATTVIIAVTISVVSS